MNGMGKRVARLGDGWVTVYGCIPHMAINETSKRVRKAIVKYLL